MNIVNKLTLRQLKLNKRRTLVTIVGVIISVAMITAVATIGQSFLELMKKEEISQSGEWHVQYPQVNREQAAKIEADTATKKQMLSQETGYAQLPGSQNPSKPYLYIKAFDAVGFEQFKIRLTEGRLPQTADELVISAEIAESAHVELGIGDRLTLEVGQREEMNPENKGRALGQNMSLRRSDNQVSEAIMGEQTREFTIVGIIARPAWEPGWAPGFTALTYVDEQLLMAGDLVNVSVVLNKVNNAIYDHASELAAEIGINPQLVSYNHSLLRYYGSTQHDGLRTTMYSLTAIIMGVIIIGSVSLIYNAFAISVSERSRYLGMLSSVGATRRQKRNSVFFEGAVIGLISIPLGFASGLLGIGITFYFINDTLKSLSGLEHGLTVTVTQTTVLLACAVSIATIFISTYLPARKASRISAIDAIRQTGDIKLTGRKVKTSRLVRKLFGMEAEIGLKNLKRNKRRYQATVFSLVISIVLFLAVSFFTDNLKRSMDLSQAGSNFDVLVDTEYGEQGEQFLHKIAALSEVTSYSIQRKSYTSLQVDTANISNGLKTQIKEFPDMVDENGKLTYSINLRALDEQSLKTYAEAVGTNLADLLDPAQMKVIVIDRMSVADDRAGKYVDTKMIHAAVGERLELELGEVEIASLTVERPLGVSSRGYEGDVYLIMSEPVLVELMKAATEERNNGYTLYLTSKDPGKTERTIHDQIAKQFTGTNLNYGASNLHANKQQEEQMIMILSVFTYGFILLITAISVANIFNTISTSISLRKREFAMLKSMGMTPKGFNKMINYESIFYGLKALLYGLPISFAVMLLIHRSLGNTFDYPFSPPWLSLAIVVAGVFAIVSAAMLYSSGKVKKENIIDAIKQESI